MTRKENYWERHSSFLCKNDIVRITTSHSGNVELNKLFNGYQPVDLTKDIKHRNIYMTIYKRTYKEVRFKDFHIEEPVS